MKRIVMTKLILSLFLFATAILPMSAQSTNPLKKPPREVYAELIRNSVRVETMLDMNAQNQVRAEQFVKGKRLVLRGRIGAITGTPEQAFTSLNPGVSPDIPFLLKVFVALQGMNRKLLMDLRMGDEVVLMVVGLGLDPVKGTIDF